MLLVNLSKMITSYSLYKVISVQYPNDISLVSCAAWDAKGDDK